MENNAVVTVRVNTVRDTNVGKYDAVEITGLDITNDRGFKKSMFATKRDGSATRNAEIAYNLNKDDWCKITLDNSEYQNVKFIKKINKPSNYTPEAGSSKERTRNSSRDGAKTTTNNKWENREGDRAAAIARAVALKAAIDFIPVLDAGNCDVDTVLDLAHSFEDYLTNGSKTAVSRPNTKQVTPAGGDDEPNEDDDDCGDPIPF